VRQLRLPLGDKYEETVWKVGRRSGPGQTRIGQSQIGISLRKSGIWIRGGKKRIPKLNGTGHTTEPREGVLIKWIIRREDLLDMGSWVNTLHPRPVPAEENIPPWVHLARAARQCE